MHRLTSEDYAVDAVTAAKALVGAWLCRRLDDGSVVRWQKGSDPSVYVLLFWGPHAAAVCSAPYRSKAFRIGSYAQFGACEGLVRASSLQ